VSAPPPARPPALTVAAARLWTWEGDTRTDYEAALKRLDALGATRTGAQGPLWRVTCDKLVRRSAGGAGKAAELFLVTTTARKGKTWVMFGSRVLELGAAAPRLLALLRAEPTKAQARIEGQEFAVGDLRVRLGTVFVGGRAAAGDRGRICTLRALRRRHAASARDYAERRARVGSHRRRAAPA
jgi:hypothetical protein